jgi:hypothetical protein
VTGPVNPWPAGSSEAEEFDAIVARLADPAQERRHARALVTRLAPSQPVPERLPGNVLFGPDVSQFQGVVLWSQVRASGCRIGGYKVSEGRTYQDPQHQNNRRNAPAAGLVPLGYHYMSGVGYAGRPDLVAAQADWYCSLVDPAAIHALDVEAPAPAPGLDVDTWVARYFTHFPRKTLTVYSNHGMWTARSHVTSRVPAGRVVTWHAGVGDGYYTSASGSLAGEWAAASSLRDSMAQLGFPPARLWQFTDHAAVPGVNGLCDGNAFQGTLAELQALAGQTGDDHMSAADVADLKAYLASDAFSNVVKAAVHGTPIGRLTNPDKTPVTLGQVESATWGALGSVDELSPQAVAAVASAVSAVLAGPLAGLPAAVAAKLGGSADAAVVKQAVTDALRESLPTFDIVAHPAS